MSQRKVLTTALPVFAVLQTLLDKFYRNQLSSLSAHSGCYGLIPKNYITCVNAMHGIETALRQTAFLEYIAIKIILL